jgi:molybdopterin synthase sulfur carrier subunit
MVISVKIPTPLRKLTDGNSTVSVSGSNITNIISDLENKYPGIKDRICEENGEIRPFVNIFVNGEDIRYLEGLNSKLSEDDEVSIVPAVAGGI